MSSATVTSRQQFTPIINLEERIRARAYELFEQRGRTHGSDLDDWLHAEAEVIGSLKAVTKTRRSRSTRN